jgi:hypothetical protein
VIADGPGVAMWDWLFQFIDPLEQAAIPYAIVGSIASSVYGEPRATNDLDLVVQLSLRDAERLVGAFPGERFYVPPVEVVAAELARSHGAHINVIALDSMVKLDVYPLPATQSGWFEKRRSLEIAGRNLWFAAPEVVILHKLIFYREGGGGRGGASSRGRWTEDGGRIDRFLSSVHRHLSPVLRSPSSVLCPPSTGREAPTDPRPPSARPA